MQFDEEDKEKERKGEARSTNDPFYPLFPSNINLKSIDASTSILSDQEFLEARRNRTTRNLHEGIFLPGMYHRAGNTRCQP